MKSERLPSVLARLEAESSLTVPILRKLAREIGRDHKLALHLWPSGGRGARVLATFIDEAARITERQMEAWVKQLDSWDICDACAYLFDKTPFAWDKAREWSAREREFEKRAGFAMMAALAVHDKAAADDRFLAFLPLIELEATDDRHFVKNAVNWALRQIGKRNRKLNRAAIACAKRIRLMDSRSARWIAADALRELQSEAVQARLANRQALYRRASSVGRTHENKNRPTAGN